MNPQQGQQQAQQPGQAGQAGQQQQAQQRTVEIRVNRRIRVPEVRVIGAEGDQLGILPIQDAIRLAEEQGLDLVEVSPKAVPPVCRIMDYGKYKYLQKKKAAEAARNSSKSQMKEVKLRPKTDEHDFQFKLEHIRRFLQEGNKAKVTMVFRGREIVHQEIGKQQLDRMAKIVLDEAIGTIESPARLEGRNMTLILAPKG